MFVLAYDNTAVDANHNYQVSINSFKKNFLPRVEIENYNIEIDGKNFYDQSIINKTRWWLDDWLFIRFYLFWKKLQTNCSSFKQTKSFRCRFKSNSTNYFYRQNESTVANTKVIIYYILEQSKETVLQFSKGTTKVL